MEKEWSNRGNLWMWQPAGPNGYLFLIIWEWSTSWNFPKYSFSLSLAVFSPPLSLALSLCLSVSPSLPPWCSTSWKGIALHAKWTTTVNESDITATIVLWDQPLKGKCFSAQVAGTTRLLPLCMDQWCSWAASWIVGSQNSIWTCGVLE